VAFNDAPDTSLDDVVLLLLFGAEYLEGET